ncbi:putative ATP-dependent zinc protease [compost metagenome]
MPVCLGDSVQQIEVNLTDRSSFDFPLLIGSTALGEFDALVDPSRSYAHGRPGCA